MVSSTRSTQHSRRLIKRIFYSNSNAIVSKSDKWQSLKCWIEPCRAIRIHSVQRKETTESLSLRYWHASGWIYFISKTFRSFVLIKCIKRTTNASKTSHFFHIFLFFLRKTVSKIIIHIVPWIKKNRNNKCLCVGEMFICFFRSLDALGTEKVQRECDHKPQEIFLLFLCVHV